MGDGIKVKDIHVLESILSHQAHPKLVDLLKWFSIRYSNTIFTCAFEERDYPSVHSMDPYRGMDIRSWFYDAPQVVADDVNDHWQYDPKRPERKCAIYHDVGRGAHLHLQVHDNTEYRS